MTVPLFAAALGTGFADLPGPVQALHRPGGGVEWRGEACVLAGGSRLARLLAGLAGFPTPSLCVPLLVRIEPVGTAERWTRWFGGHRLRSVIRPGPCPGTVVERFGPLRFEMAVVGDGARLRQVVAGCRLGPWRLPHRLAPGGGATEDVDAWGRYRFAAEATLPWGTRLVRYEGWLVQSP